MGCHSKCQINRTIIFLLPTAHLVLFIWLISTIEASHGESKYMAWILFYIIDLPISLILVPVQYLLSFFELGYWKTKVLNFWGPAVYFGIFGTAWWFYISKLLVKKFKVDDSRA